MVHNLTLHGHLGARSWWIDNLLLGSAFAVDIFFILSGYIMVTTYGMNLRPRDFFVHRSARIFPLHVAVLAAMVAGFALLTAAGITTSDRSFFAWQTLPYHFTLTSVWFWLPVGWNSPSWSVSAELGAYLIFPVFQFAVRPLSRRVIVVLAVIFTALFCVVVYAYGFAVTGLPAILRATVGFLCGATLCLATEKLAIPPSAALVGIAALAGLSLAGSYWPAVLAIVVMIPALASARSGAAQHALSHPVMVWLGNASYAIYLLHAPLLIVALLILGKTGLLPSTLGLALFCAGYLVTLLICAHIAWRALERPARYAIRRALGASGHGKIA